MSEVRYVLCHPLLEKRFEALDSSPELPTLPDVFLKMRKILNNPEKGAKDAAKIIANDSSLSMKVLKVVNSAAYGLKNPCTHVDQAISLLGLNQVSNIVLSATVVKQFPAELGKRQLDLLAFWKHSLATAVGAQMLARTGGHIPKQAKEEAFIAGLTHDMGKLVELQYFSEDFSTSLDLCKKEHLTLQMAESKVFRFSHQDSGAHLADVWNMERSIVKTMELHNTPEDLSEQDEAWPLVCVVHTANILTHLLNLGSGGDPFIPKLHPPCMDYLKLDPLDLAELSADVFSGFQELGSFLEK